jgi:uroporphyrinogen-III synthase
MANQPRVLLTRPEEDIERDKKIFLSLGIEVIPLPLIGFRPLDFKIPPLGGFDYIYFGSKRAVDFFLSKVKKLPSHLRVLVVGKKTANHLREKYSVEPFLVAKGSSKLLYEEIKNKNLAAGKVLVPTAKVHSKGIYLLERLGFELHIVPVYETVFLRYPQEEIKAKLAKADILIFTSPSTFLALLANLQLEQLFSLIKGKKIVAIGETTKKAIEDKGLKVDWVPSEPSMELIAKEIKKWIT